MIEISRKIAKIRSIW